MVRSEEGIIFLDNDNRRYFATLSGEEYSGGQELRLRGLAPSGGTNLI